MGKPLLFGTLYLSLLALPACGSAGSRPEPTEVEYWLYRGTGEDLQEQEDLTVISAAGGAMGSAPGQAPLLVASALIAGRVANTGNGTSPFGRRTLSRSAAQERGRADWRALYWHPQM